MKCKIEGILAANITPFTREGKIDEIALRSHVGFLLRNGINGLFACGTYGEGPAMSLEQRKKTMQILVETVDNRVPVIVEIGTMNTDSSIELNKHAQAVNVDAVASIPPWYYHHDKQEILTYYEDVASATDLPFFVYNNPARTGINITPELLLQMTEKIDNVVGLKDSSENLVQFSKYVRLINKPGFHHIIGSDDITLGGLAMGATGAIVVLANIFPELHTGLFRAFKNKDFERARQLQHQFNWSPRWFCFKATEARE
jgi:4-hydroxy-tetrahydrodipicolinate synthase